MAQDIPESKPVVQLPVATHSSIYSHNLTKKDYWINCQAGGLGFYTLLGRNPITLISVGSTSQKIMPAFQIDIGHDYECWLNMLLSMCWDSKFHGFRLFPIRQHLLPYTRFLKKRASRCQNVYKMRYLVSPSEERALMLTVLSLLQPMPSS